MTLCTYEYILSKQVTLLTVSDIYKRNEIPIAARSASLLRPITHPRKPLHFPTPSLGLKTELSALALAVPTVAPEH